MVVVVVVAATAAEPVAVATVITSTTHPLLQLQARSSTLDTAEKRSCPTLKTSRSVATTTCLRILRSNPHRSEIHGPIGTGLTSMVLREEVVSHAGITVTQRAKYCHSVPPLPLPLWTGWSHDETRPLFLQSSYSIPSVPLHELHVIQVHVVTATAAAWLLLAGSQNCPMYGAAEA